jgi:pyridinium-3,5-biscarboxylic acid mononucleotide synthase
MTRHDLQALLAAVQGGTVSIDHALDRLRSMPFEDLGFARLDHHRALRNGFPEVVLGEGKTEEQVVAIATRLAAAEQPVLITRLVATTAAALMRADPAFVYHALPRLAVRAGRPITTATHGTVLVASAGTADLSVAEEAAISAEVMGNRVERLYDVGVAGLHRLLGERERLWRASVLIVVAGMEGALPSVVGGLVDAPVVAVPTSVGYGSSFGGVAALLGMLNTCASGVVVVNIDNGFGAAAAATRMNRVRPPTSPPAA